MQGHAEDTQQVHNATRKQLCCQIIFCEGKLLGEKVDGYAPCMICKENLIGKVKVSYVQLKPAFSLKKMKNKNIYQLMPEQV